MNTLTSTQAQAFERVRWGPTLTARSYSQAPSFWWREVSSPMMRALWPPMMPMLSGCERSFTSHLHGSCHSVT